MTAIVERDCWECSEPSWSRTRAPASRAMSTPALVSQGLLDAGVEPTFGGPGEVDGGRSEHPDPLRIVREPFGEAQAQAVLALRILAKDVLVDRDEGIGQRRRLAYLEPLAISVCAVSEEGSVL